MDTKKYKSCSIPVTARNKNFKSITAFCDEYGLKYSTINRLLRKGYSPDEILDRYGTLPITTRYTEDSILAQKYSYNGVKYPSLIVAADTLGISLDKIMRQQKNNPNISLDKAIAAAINNEEEQNNESTKSRRKKHIGEITIAGVTYDSMQAALLAYGMKYTTVISRMERDSISFEEALCKGSKERRHITPYLSQPIISEKPANTTYQPLQLENNSNDFIVKINKILVQSSYKPQLWYDSSSQVGVICFEENLYAISEPRPIILTFDYPYSYPFSIEFSIPNLYLIQKNNNKPLPLMTRTNILQKINDLQNKYLNAVITLNENKITTRWLYTITGDSINIRQFLIILHRFIGTSAAIFDELTKKNST